MIKLPETAVGGPNKCRMAAKVALQKDSSDNIDSDGTTSLWAGYDVIILDVLTDETAQRYQAELSEFTLKIVCQSVTLKLIIQI
jgi:hypothetical protein